MKKHQTVRKKSRSSSYKILQPKKKKKKEKEMNARIFIKLQENTDSSKDMRDMRFNERSFKLRRMSKNEDSSRRNLIKLRKVTRRKKVRYISSKKCV